MVELLGAYFHQIVHFVNKVWNFSHELSDTFRFEREVVAKTFNNFGIIMTSLKAADQQKFNIAKSQNKRINWKSIKIWANFTKTL